jgi:hypothetical protein
VTDKDRLEDFCRWVQGREGRPLGAEPGHLAALFREFFRIERTLSLQETLDMASSLGIRAEEVDYLSTAAVNMWHRTWHIHYSYRDPPGTKKFSLLHEVFEIIDKTFRHLVRGYSGLSDPRLSRYADRFAAAVLTPPDFFTEKMTASGCDAVLLGRELELSHQMLLIGFAQSLPEIAPEVIFGAALYDYVFSGFSTAPMVQEYVANLVVRTPQARYMRRLCSCQRLPPRGGSAVPGSLVCLAIRNNLPVLCRPDYWGGDYDPDRPAILVRPIPWRGEDPGRVVLLAIADGQFDLVQPQVERLDPVSVPADVPVACHDEEAFWRCPDRPCERD